MVHAHISNNAGQDYTSYLLLARQIVMSLRAAIGPTVMLVAVGLAGLVAPAPPPPPLATPRPDLLALTQDYWHWKTQDYPQFATQVSLSNEALSSDVHNIVRAYGDGLIKDK